MHKHQTEFAQNKIQLEFILTTSPTLEKIAILKTSLITFYITNMLSVHESIICLFLFHKGVHTILFDQMSINLVSQDVVRKIRSFKFQATSMSLSYSILVCILTSTFYRICCKEILQHDSISSSEIYRFIHP